MFSEIKQYIVDELPHGLFMLCGGDPFTKLSTTRVVLGSQDLKASILEAMSTSYNIDFVEFEDTINPYSVSDNVSSNSTWVVDMATKLNTYFYEFVDGQVEEPNIFIINVYDTMYVTVMENKLKKALALDINNPDNNNNGNSIDNDVYNIVDLLVLCAPLLDLKTLRLVMCKLKQIGYIPGDFVHHGIELKCTDLNAQHYELVSTYDHNRLCVFFVSYIIHVCMLLLRANINPSGIDSELSLFMKAYGFDVSARKEDITQFISIIKAVS